MTNNDLNGLHRLAGSDEQQEGGLIIKKKTSATTSDDQHIFKVPKIPSTISSSSLGLDKLATEQRRAQSSTAKRFKSDDEFSESKTNKSRQLREQRVETPSSTRSSHHDYYDKSRPQAKNPQRGLAYGKDEHKQRRSNQLKSVIDFILGRHNDRKEDDDDDRYATPNIRGSRGKE